MTGPVLPCLWLLYRPLPHMAINLFAVEKESDRKTEKGKTERCLILKTQPPAPCKKIQGLFLKQGQKEPLAAPVLLSFDP